MLARLRRHQHRVSGFALTAMLVLCMNLAIAPCLMAMPNASDVEHCDSRMTVAQVQTISDCVDCVDSLPTAPDHCPEMTACVEPALDIAASNEHSKDICPLDHGRSVAQFGIAQTMPAIRNALAGAPPESLSIRYCRFLI
jgi:hypothetical protein